MTDRIIYLASKQTVGEILRLDDQKHQVPKRFSLQTALILVLSSIIVRFHLAELAPFPAYFMLCKDQVVCYLTTLKVSCLSQLTLSPLLRKSCSQIRRLSTAPAAMASRTYAVSQQQFLRCILPLTNTTGRRRGFEYVTD